MESTIKPDAAEMAAAINAAIGKKNPRLIKCVKAVVCLQKGIRLCGLVPNYVLAQEAISASRLFAEAHQLPLTTEIQVSYL